MNITSHTGRLKLPYITQAQAQKEVTHNQALNILDVLVNTVAVSISNAPADKPNEGDIYIVGKNPQGIFDGNANNLTQLIEGCWSFYQPINYMEVMVVDKNHKFTYVNGEWISLISTSSDSSSNKDNTTTKNSSQLEIMQWEEDLKIEGKVVTSKNVIPHHSLVLAVNMWVIEAVTGVQSFTVGVKDDPSRYGDRLSSSKDTTNIGMTYHPITYFYDTPITIMPSQMEFTGGVVKICVQYLKPRGSWKW